MLEENSKKLNIIAITDQTPFGDTAVRYGGILAAIFHASLTVITHFGFKPEKITDIVLFQTDILSKKDIWKEEIKQIEEVVEKEKPLSAPFYKTISQLSENEIETFIQNEYYFPQKLYRYAEETNTVMFVIGVSKQKKETVFSLRKAAKFIRPSRLPVMTVGKIMPKASVFQSVILPLDIERQAKEKVLWAGYFSRFYHAVVHVIHTEYKDEFLKNKLKANIAFTEKLYKNLKIKYQLHSITPTVDNMDKHSIEYARQIEASLTVIMMTRFYSLIDLLIGPREFSVIGNDEGLPVLCINERDDLYVLCT